MNLQELIVTSITEFLDVDVRRDTETLDLASKIEIVRNRVLDKMKNQTPDPVHTENPKYEYEMFFSSNPNDKIKIDGWIPVDTGKIGPLDKISEYIEIGLLRKIKPFYFL